MKRALLGILVLLVLLLAVADRVAKGIAEDRIADQVAGELSSTPEVHVHGWPFLTQAVSGSYADIEVTGAGVRRSGLPVASFHADLHDVRVPLEDVVQGQVDAVPVGRVVGVAVLGLADVAEASGQDIRLEVVGDQLRVTGAVSVLGRQVTVSALSTLSLRGDTLTITAGSYEVGGQPAPREVSQAVGRRLDVSVRVPDLPYDLRVTAVRVGTDGLEATAEARDTVLTR